MSTFQNYKIPNDGLVLYYDASNIKSYGGSGTRLLDLSRSSQDATLVNGVSFASGYLTFDGADDGILLDYKQELNDLQSPLTITGWFMDSLTGINGPNFVQSIFSQYTDVTIGNYVKAVNLYQRTIYYGSSSISGSPYLQSFSLVGLTYSVSTWNFFSVTVDGNLTASVITIGLNGIFQTFSATQMTPVNSANIWIGNATDLGGNRFKGNLSSLSVYNKSLTNDEVLKVYESTKTKYI